MDTMDSQIPSSDSLSELSRSPSPPPINHEAGSDDPLPPTGPRRRYKPRRKKRSLAQKIEEVCKSLRDFRLGIWDLLWGLSEKNLLGSHTGPRLWTSFMDRLHGKDDRLLERLLYAPGSGASNLSVSRCRRVKTLDDLEWGQDILRQEALSVARLPYFGEWHKSQPNTIENFDMDDLLSKIQTEAPHLYNLLDHLIQPEAALRRHRVVKQRQSSLVGIFATICYGQQRVLANNLPTQLGLYLHANGVKPSVIRVLARLGICVGYDKIIRCTKELQENEIEAIKAIDQDPTVVTRSDNLEQVKGVGHQQIDNEKENVFVNQSYSEYARLYETGRL